MDNQIKEAVMWIKEDGAISIYEKTLLDLAEKYLQASEVMPSKMVCAFHADNNQDGCPFCEHAQTKNKTIDACTFSLMKKMENLPKAMLKEFTIKADGTERPLATIDNLCKFIQEYLMGREK